jgi:L-lactate dehydrogenase complex protein LldG
MTDSARSQLFAKLRGCSSGTPAAELERELLAIGRAPAAALPSPDLCAAFLANVLKNQGTVDCAGNRSETVKAVGQYVYQHFRSHRLVASNDSRLAAMPWRDAGVLPRFGSVEPGEPVALSFARLAIAETGSIITWTGKANPAANNLLPEHHIVLVDSADLVTTMEQAWDSINQEMTKTGRPRGINFIAGPSSTGDIEGKLVYGAHGPRSWHVILMGDVPLTALDEARELASQ